LPADLAAVGAAVDAAGALVGGAVAAAARVGRGGGPRVGVGGAVAADHLPAATFILVAADAADAGERQPEQERECSRGT
jgi:hypothetical protein